MTYEIDSTAVNDREDWRAQLYPAPPQGQREEQLPGVAERFMIVGQAMPPDIQVVGFLEAEESTVALAADTLFGQLQDLNAMKADADSHTVTLHDTEFEDCFLAEIVTLESPKTVVASTDGSVKLRQQVRMRWRQLK